MSQDGLAGGSVWQRELDVNPFVPGVEVAQFLGLEQRLEGTGNRPGRQIAEFVEDQV